MACCSTWAEDWKRKKTLVNLGRAKLKCYHKFRRRDEVDVAQNEIHSLGQVGSRPQGASKNSGWYSSPAADEARCPALTAFAFDFFDFL